MPGSFVHHDLSSFSRQATTQRNLPVRVKRQPRLAVSNVLDTKPKPNTSPINSTPSATQPATSTSGNSNLWSYVSETTTSLASGLLPQFRIWGLDEVAGPQPSSQEVEAQLRQTGKALEEASRQTKEEHARTVPPDIAKFLQPTDVKTIKLIRVVSALSAMTYKMDQLTPKALRRKLGLELVTTSKACERCTYEHAKSAEEVIAEGDGMAAAVAPALETPEDLLFTEASNIVALPTDLKFTSISAPVPNAKRWKSPAEVVQSKLAEAAAAASAAASAASAAAIAPFAAAEHLYKATQVLVSAKEVVDKNSDRPFRYSASKGVSVTRASTDTDQQLALQVQAAPPPPTCPSEWFICDDVQKEVRYMVIQGSDSIDHWRCNLTFDPVTFEDPEFGVKVHRGVYDAALALYDRFLPLIQEQLDLSPFSKICFTGHSIGGSLATVLMLMFVHRGVLPANRIAPVYTFGAPSVFCEGQLSSCTGASACCSSCSDHSSPSGQPRGLLHSLGLRDRDICNVLMHRDIVPRAFACDYSLVADILKTWGPSFRDHCCLGNDSRKLMYNFIGTMMVLQPAAHLTFVNKEPYHPMLPEGPGLHCLVEPYLVSTITAKAHREVAIREGRPVGKEVPSLRQAILELMDTPHPLETLYDAGAYGPHGSISRYHNPDNYTLALGAVIRDKQHKAQRRLQLQSGGRDGRQGGGLVAVEAVLARR